ncbi:hypothetical protein, partial [Microbacterium lacticum]|uniref:hypothetical protein n=1 Tax=Microbacterium lacticum TaxID=33885 RepID=UPI0019D5864F
MSTPSWKATGVAAVASIHDDRLTGSSCSSTSGQASRTCPIEIGPAGGVGAGATGAEAAGAEAAGAEAAGAEAAGTEAAGAELGGVAAGAAGV